MEGTVERFRHFVSTSRALLETAPPSVPMDAFRAFLTRATPLATAHARPLIDRLTPLANVLESWIVPHDLLEVAGYAWVETAYTSLVGWALYPPGRPDVALACQRAWAARVAPGLVVDRAAEPHHQLWTEDGVPDLVLAYDAGLLVVEAKTKTLEHPAPSGTPQTLAYARSAPRALGIAHAAKPCHVVYLTVNGSEAANPDARPCSYASLAGALASTLDMLAPDDPLRSAYAMLITHFVRCAVPSGVDLIGVLNRIKSWADASSAPRPSEILAHLASIQSAATLLLAQEVM